MGSHPVNLAPRFLLELAALLALGIWEWQQSESWLRFVLVLAVPIIAAAIWGTLNVPHDPSRSGAAPVVVPGVLRLDIELDSLFSLPGRFTIPDTRASVGFWDSSLPSITSPNTIASAG